MTIEEIKNYIKENNTTEIYILTTQYDTKKSFYNKALVKVYNNIKVLYSYDTPVCYIYDNSKYIMYYLNYDIKDSLLFSNTTLRHIKEFLLQNINILRLSHMIDGKLTKSDIIKNNEKEL